MLSHTKPKPGSPLALFIFCCLGLLYSPASSLADDNDADLFRLGTVHYQRGQWQFAIGRFKEILKTSNNEELKANSKFYLAESLVAAQNLKEAQKYLLQFITEYPEHQLITQATFRLGEVSYLLKDFKNAKLHLAQFAETNEGHPFLEFALPYLGEMELKDGHVNRAVELFQKSLKEFPAGKLADESRFGLARGLEKSGSLEESIRFYQYLIDHPDSGRMVDSVLQLAKIKFRGGQYRQAIELLTRITSDHPKHDLRIPAYYWMGRAHSELGDLVRAEKNFSLALEDRPKANVVPALKFELAKCLVKQKRQPEAIDHLKEIVSKYPDSEWADDSLLLNIQILRNGKQDRLAIRLCDEFHKVYPRSEIAMHVVEAEAECYFGMEEYQKAKNCFSQLIRYNDKPESGIDWSNNQAAWNYKLAVCSIRLKEISEALKRLESIDLENSPKEIASAASLALATIQIERHQYSNAVKNLVRFVEAQPDSPETSKCIIDIALLMAKLRNYQEADNWVRRIEDRVGQVATAIQMADIAFAQKQFVFASSWYGLASRLAKNPEVKCRAMMGSIWSARELGNIESTIILAERLADRFPESDSAPEAVYLVAVLNEKSGGVKKAIRAYEKLINRYPDCEYYQQAVISTASLYRKHLPNRLDELVIPLSRLISSGNGETDKLMYELAWTLKDLEQFDKSQQCFEKLAKQFPNSPFARESNLQAALFLSDKGDTDTAIESLSRLAEQELEPKLANTVHYQLAQLLFAKAEYETARQYWKQVIQSPLSSELKDVSAYWAAESSYRLQEWSAAAEGFRSLNAQVDSGEDLYIKSLVRLGQTQVKLQQWNNALDTAERMKEAPDSGMTHALADFIAGRAHSGLGIFSKARKSFERVLENSSAKGTETAAMAQWMIGESWFHQEEFKKAIDAYQRTEILHAYPEWQAAALLQSGTCFELLGDAPNAKTCFQRVVKEFSQSEYAHTAKTRLELLAQSTNAGKGNQKIKTASSVKAVD